MGTLSKKELIARIKNFLEIPGICVQEKRNKIIALCQSMSEDNLAKIAATLRIRYRSLLSDAQSKEMRTAIAQTRTHLEKTLKKYGLKP